MTIPQFDMSWWDDVESIQAWGDLEESIPVIDPPEELDNEYENIPGLTSAEEAWSEYIPVEEFPAAAASSAAEPLEVVPEEGPSVPALIMDTAAADVPTVSRREEGL